MHTKITHNGRSFIIGLQQIPAQVENHLSHNLYRGVLETQRTAQNNAPKSSSLLTRAIQVNQLDKFTWELVAATNYSAPVEEGSAPGGLAPVQAIYDWIKQNQITPHNPDMDQMDLAFVIQRTIQTRGIKPQPYMQPALVENTPRLNQLINQAIQDGLK